MLEMEVVKLFNNELSSLYETRPPISKAKMTTITRTAIKAIKFYKHVVQSVEKFIQKCKPEYKVPGLYVIDSIVRQSRHQFTPEKDVFAPRFARNITVTFQHLFNCPHDDKGKIVRVLNLWQKNQVFTPEVIQPLLDMASREQPSANGIPSRPVESKPSPAKEGGGWGSEGATPQPVGAPPKLATSTTPLDPLTTPPVGTSGGESSLLQCLETLALPSSSSDNNHKDDMVKFDKKLLDFDYGEDDEDEASPQPTQPLPSLDSLTSILSNPEVLRQLQTLQAQMSRNAQEEEKSRRLQEMRTQEEEFDKHLAQTLPNLPFASECEFNKGSGNSHGGAGGSGDVMSLQAMLQQQPQPVAPPTAPPHLPSYRTLDETAMNPPAPGPSVLDYDERTRSGGGVGGSQGGVVEVIDLIRMEAEGRGDSPPRRRRRSRSRSPRRARSPSRSRRRRSRSGERGEYERTEWGDTRKTREVERERERERRRKGLPTIKKHHLAVCSTTLWIGHLSKLVQQEELSDTFGEYGDIVSINLIPPRGCAFVCMNRRQDAARALHQLKHYKLQGKAITIAWAPGKGMKDREWKDYWEVDQGVSYIPWSKLTSDTNFELLEEGGTLDPETFPEWLTEKIAAKREKEQRALLDGGSVGVDKAEEGGELDIPMPGPPLGYIPIPPPDPAPVSTPIPPPMGILPPFALPPNNVGLMGMGLMSNVPLGVPPPLMMGPPQQMVPRMPASPFNPPILLGGGDKGKPGLGPASGDSFPEHLGPLVTPFALPVPISVVDPRLRRMDVAVEMAEHPGSHSVKLSPSQSLNPGPGILPPAVPASKLPQDMDIVKEIEPIPKDIPPPPTPVSFPTSAPSGNTSLPPDLNESKGTEVELKDEEGSAKESTEEETQGGAEGGEGNKNQETPSQGQAKRQRRWPRVNRWGDSSPPPQNRSPAVEGPPPPLMGEHHFPPPPPRPPLGMMSGGGFVKDGRVDERGDEEMVFLPRGFFPPRGPPRPPPPRPLLRTPNGPMFGPRPPGMMPPMRGPPRPPPGMRGGPRMDGMGFGGPPPPPPRGMVRGGRRGAIFQRRWGGPPPPEAPECV